MPTFTLKSTGGDYVSMVTWEAARQGTPSEPEILDCYIGTTTNGGWQSWGALQESVTIAGWSTSASAYPHVRAAPDDPNGSFQIYANFVVGQHTFRLDVGSDYTRIEGLFIQSHSAQVHGIALTSCSNALIEKCFINGAAGSPPGDQCHGISLGGAINCTVRNCLVYGNWDVGIVVTAVDSANTIANNTVVGAASGIGYGNVQTYDNNVVYGNTNWQWGNWGTTYTGTARNNASSDNSQLGTNPVTAVVEADFVDYAGGDYTPATGGQLDRRCWF
jgi:parallel beta-helix repeat protein